MKRGGLSLVIAGLAIMVMGGPTTERSLAQAQPRAEAAPQPQWWSVTVVRVKPDMLTEWQEFQKNETIPALKKGGAKERHVWQTAAFGEAYEYVFATPIENLAQYDSPSILEKALGQDGLRAYGAKNRRLIASSHTYGSQLLGELSHNLPNLETRPKLAIVTSTQVAAGRTRDFENYIKSDILPVMKQAKAPGYWMHRTIFGGDVNEYVSVTLYDSFADIAAGPPTVRILGREGAARLTQKVGPLIVRQERSVMRYNADLSFRTTPTSSQ